MRPCPTAHDRADAAFGGDDPTSAPTPSPADEGVHRDPTLDDPIGGGSLSQRVVRAASSVLGRSSSRRSFLTKTAVVGSALAVDPLGFVLRPGTAYGAVCGTCGDGWTAFCCTVNGGHNACPPGSFVAGWWKADNAAYCCGAARYIVDCNASCPTSCGCRCSGAACDGRRTCCNQFRYGQCHQEISCYGPVVCRVATCTPAWQYDRSCTTTNATDNRTVDHGAPCLPDQCAPPPSPIAAKYASLGGAGGILGPVVREEQPVLGGSGRFAGYVDGDIYWREGIGAHEVHGPILTELARTGSVVGPLGYPVSDVGGPSSSAISSFQSGEIYSWARGAFSVHGAIFLKYHQVGGPNGALGWPMTSTRTTTDGVATYVSFERGRIYFRPGVLTDIRGWIFDKHEQLGGVSGFLGYPISDELGTADGRGRMSWFQHGFVFWSIATGVHEVHGGIAAEYVRLGGDGSLLGLPTSDEQDSGGGGRMSTFERGRIYCSFPTGTFAVANPFLHFWLARGGPVGGLGFPSSGEYAGYGLRFQNFTGGRITFDPATGGYSIG